MNDIACDHPSSGSVNKAIEVAILRRMDVQYADWIRVNWIDVSKKYQLPAVWEKAKPDAVWETKSAVLIVAECYARIERLKAGNKGKLAKDCLKLRGIQLQLAHRFKQVRCLMIMPEELAAQLKGVGWLETSIRQTVEVVGVSLLESERRDLMAAVLKQADGQSRTAYKPDVSK